MHYYLSPTVAEPRYGGFSYYPLLMQRVPPGEAMYAREVTLDAQGLPLWWIASCTVRLADESGNVFYVGPTAALSGPVSSSLRNFVRNNMGLSIPNGWSMKQCLNWLGRNLGLALNENGDLILGGEIV